MAVLEQKSIHFTEGVPQLTFEEALHQCTNLEGKVRLKPAREYFVGELDSLGDLQTLAGVYDQWKQEVDYFALRVRYREKLTDKHPTKSSTWAVKCAKRGNDVYAKLRIEKKLAGLYDIGTLVEEGEVYASFLTLTCDPKVYGWSRTRAWEDLSRKWNRFITWIRKMNPCFLGVFRVYEATERGYPHVHALLFWSFSKWIPQAKLTEQWGAHTWIEKCRDVKGSIGYLVKYLKKGFTDEGHMGTPAMLWLLKKRSYSVSKALLHLIQSMHNSNSRQITLSGDPSEMKHFEALGVYSIERLQKIAAQLGSQVEVTGWYVVLDFDPKEGCCA